MWLLARAGYEQDAFKQVPHAGDANRKYPTMDIAGLGSAISVQNSCYPVKNDHMRAKMSCYSFKMACYSRYKPCYKPCYSFKTVVLQYF